MWRAAVAGGTAEQAELARSLFVFPGLRPHHAQLAGQPAVLRTSCQPALGACCPHAPLPPLPCWLCVQMREIDGATLAFQQHLNALWEEYRGLHDQVATAATVSRQHSTAQRFAFSMCCCMPLCCKHPMAAVCSAGMPARTPAVCADGDVPVKVWFTSHDCCCPLRCCCCALPGRRKSRRLQASSALLLQPLWSRHGPHWWPGPLTWHARLSAAARRPPRCLSWLRC